MKEQQKASVSLQDGDINLLDYLIVLVKYSRMIIFTTLGVAVCTYIVLLFFPFEYTATTRFIPPQQELSLSGQVLQGLGTSSLPGGDRLWGNTGMASMLGLQSSNELYVGILKGDAIFDRMIERFNLRELYQTKYIEHTRQVLLSKAEIEMGKAGLITIDVTDRDPQRAANMANAFLEELVNLMKRLMQHEARTHLAFLDEKRSEAGDNLAKAESELRTFSEKTNVFAIDAQAMRMIEYIASMRATIDFKEVELEVLRGRATENNYDVIRIETELKSLREKLRSAESQDAAKAICGDVMISTNRMPELGVEYLRRFRELKYQEGLYTLYTKLVELARIDQTRETPFVLSVVDRATPPEHRSKPKRMLTTLIVTGVIFFLLIFFVFAKEYWQTLRLAEENSGRMAQLSSYWQEWQRSWLCSWPKKLFPKKKTNDQ